MKYEISGVKPNRTIETVMDTDDVIYTFYLDGSSDIFENKPIIWKKINETLEEQSQRYTVDGEKRLKLLRDKIATKRNNAAILLIIFIISVITSFCTKLIPTGGSIGTIAAGVVSIISGISTIANCRKARKLNKKKQDLEKYMFFTKFREVLQKGYKGIIEKENRISQRRSEEEKTVNLSNIDTTTLQELREMIIKYARYTSIDKESTVGKTKTIGTYPQN